MNEIELALWLEHNFWIVQVCVFIGVFIGVSTSLYWFLGRLRSND